LFIVCVFKSVNDFTDEHLVRVLVNQWCKKSMQNIDLWHNMQQMYRNKEMYREMSQPNCL